MNTHSSPLSRRNRLRLAVTTALAPALILGVPAATQAAATGHWVTWASSRAVTLPSCPGATMCTFQNSGYRGTRWDYSYNSRPDGVWFYVGNGANDQISSFYNNRAWYSWIAKNCPAGSLAIGLEGGLAVPNLNDGRHKWEDGSNVNDSISAIGFDIGSQPYYPAHGNPAHGGC